MATMQESEPLQQGTETSGTEREFNMFAADGVAPTTPPSQQVEVDMPEAKEEPLDFINVSSGVDHQGESEVVLPGSEAAPTSVWGKVVTGFETAKSLRHSMTADLAPWTKFADRSKFSVPGKTEAYGRVRNNLKVYHSNYGYLLGGLAIWTAISNLYFVLAMAASVGGYYYYRMATSDGTVFVFRGREIAPVQFYLGLTGFTLLMFWLTGGGSAMFWLVILSLILVFGHAGAREIDTEDTGSEQSDFSSTFGALTNLSALRGV